jgi:GntR family transcriptional regulator, transcriptional repressor for pyruvate dehydrogenase complex
MVKTFARVDRGRYSEQVIQMVVTKIMNNSFAVGDKLPSEKVLTEQFDVSRTVVREALRTLEESGLVEIKKGPKGGVFVTNSFHKPVSSSFKNLIQHGMITLDHLFTVRELIEPHIALQAAMNAKPEDLEPIRALIGESLSHPDDVTLLKKNNILFHLLLAKAAGNPLLSILMESVIELQEEFAKSFADLPFGLKHTEGHAKLLRLIEQKRAPEAQKLITKDIEGIKEKLRKFLEDLNKTAGA